MFAGTEKINVFPAISFQGSSSPPVLYRSQLPARFRLEAFSQK